MRSLTSVGPVLAATVIALAAPGVASASCGAPPKGEDLLATASKATAVFIGTAQAGDNANDQLLSPIAFTVDAWLSGDRSGTSVSVTNGFARTPDGGFVATSVALNVRAGEQWMLDAQADKDGALKISECGPLTRRVDLNHPRTVRVHGGKAYTPLPVDFLGRATGGDAAPELPASALGIARGTTRIAGAHIEALRVIHAGKPRAAKRVSKTAWSVGKLSKNDRLAWLDDRGLWGGIVR